MHIIVLRLALIYFLSHACVSFAQTPPAVPDQNPLSTHSRHLYQGATKILVRSAEQMPAEKYGYKPADTVRTFGQVVGHIADSQYFFCSAVLGEKNPSPKIEKTVSSKAELVAALQSSMAYCKRAYDGLTDATAGQMVKHMGRDMPRLGVLTVNQVHAIEHYGNLVTYMRMNDLVPPTSDPAFMKELMN